MDDQFIISTHFDLLSDIKNIDQAFTHDAFMSSKGELFYRPVQTISFMIDAQIGGEQPWIYHLTNLLLHVIVVIALFFFLKKTGIKEEISFLLSLFFSINPLLTHAIAWIPARGDLLLGLFSLLSFITFLEYFRKKKTIFLILHTSAFLLAVFSKETSVLLPVFMLSFLFISFRKMFRLKEILPFLLIWGFSFAIFYFLRERVIIKTPASNIVGITAILKNLPVIPITFGKFFLPINLCTLPIYDTLSLITGIFVLGAFTVIAIKFTQSEISIVLWGAIWFLAFNLPPMLIRPTISDFSSEYFEYRSYLPVIGILIMMGIIAKGIPSRYSVKKIFRITIPVLIIYAILAFNHSGDFTDPLSFFQSAVNGSSHNAFALTERGSIYFRNSRTDLALADFDNASKICPHFSALYFDKGELYFSINDPLTAEKYYKEALKYDTTYTDINGLKDFAFINLASVLLGQQKYDEIIPLLKNAELKYPDNASIHNNLGLAYYAKAEFNLALAEYGRAILTDQLKNISYYNNRGMTKYNLKDYQGALADFNSVLLADPKFQDTWNNRGITKIELGDYQGAISDLTTAINFNPNNTVAWYYRGTAYAKLNMNTEAEANRQKAIQLGYKIP